MLRAFQNDGAPTPEGQGDSAQPPRGNHNGDVIRFGPDGKLYVQVASEFESSSKRNRFYRQLADRMSGIAGIERVAGGTMPPLHSGPRVSVRSDEDASDRVVRVSAQDVTTGFF